MGGLMKYMPLTGVTVLIASFSISGVPLTNGFVSKWAMLAAAIQAAPYARFLPLCAAVGVLTSALTLALFIKFFGAGFLSRTSALVQTRVKEHGKLEVRWMMQGPQVFLASLCLILGIVPVVGFQIMQKAIESSRQGFGIALAANAPIHSGVLAGLSEVTSTAIFVPLAMAGVLALTFLLAYVISRLGQARRRSAVPWLCGYAREAECHRYVARNFYGEIKRYLRWGRVRPAQ